MWHEIEETLTNAERSLAEYKKWAREYAQAERNYRVALSKRLLEKKAEGCPATILSDVVRGEEEIAELKQLRASLSICKVILNNNGRLERIDKYNKNNKGLTPSIFITALVPIFRLLILFSMYYLCFCSEEQFKKLMKEDNIKGND